MTIKAGGRCDIVEAVTRQSILREQLSRREVSTLLALHPDSVSRLLADGLAAAVIEWGGRGKEMKFSRVLVAAWQRARACTRRAGRPCSACALVLEDFGYFAEHLLEVRHGGHLSCTDADGNECGYPWAADIADTRPNPKRKQRRA